MPIRYYAGDTRPEPVECQPMGWPHRDAKGREQFINTHFDTVEAAWKKVQENADASVSLAASAVEHARKRLQEAEREAADAVVLHAAAQRAQRESAEGGE